MELSSYGSDKVVNCNSYSEWLSDSSALVLENKSILSGNLLPQNGCSLQTNSVETNQKMESTGGNYSHPPQPLYQSIHPSKHPSSLLSTKPKTNLKEDGKGGYVTDRVRALSISNKSGGASAALNPLSQSVSSVQGFLSGLSSKNSSKGSLDTSSFCSGYSTGTGKFSRGENLRASYNDKRSAKISMFSSNKISSSKKSQISTEINVHVQDSKWYSAGDSDSDSGLVIRGQKSSSNTKEKKKDANNQYGSLSGKKYQQHHQSSSSLDLELDHVNGGRKTDRSLSDRRMTPLLHREFGSQGSIDIIGKYNDDTTPEFMKKNSRLQYKRESDATSVLETSPKPRPKRLTSKLWGDKDRPSIFRKLKSNKDDASKDDDSSGRDKGGVESSRTEDAKSVLSSRDGFEGMDRSVLSTPSQSSHKGSSRMTSLLCTSTSYNPNASFSGSYTKVDSNEPEELGSLELLADSRLSSFHNKTLHKTKISNNSTKYSSSSGDGTKNFITDKATEVCEVTTNTSSKQVTGLSIKGKSKNSTSVNNNVNISNDSKSGNNKDAASNTNNKSSNKKSHNKTDEEEMIMSSPYIYQPGFAHHDVKSMSVMLLPEHIQSILSGGRNTITGATAAAVAYNNNGGNLTTSNSTHSLYSGTASATTSTAAAGGDTETDNTSAAETLVDVDNIEQGDGRCNALLQSCSYFCNELGGENERNVSLTKESAVTASLVSKCAPDGTQESTESINVQYITKNPHQYLHRPTAAYTIGVLESLANWISFPATAAAVASGGSSSTSSDQQSNEPEVHPSVMRQELCPYVRTAICVEEYDSDTSYYKSYFCGQDHQNYLGNDEGGFGPVAISYRRERIPAEAICNNNNPCSAASLFSNPSIASGSSASANDKTSLSAVLTTPVFLHRIIIRTAQLSSLQGSLVEYTSSDPSSSNSKKSNSGGSGSGGGPGLREALDYLCPKLPTSCLYQAQNTDKTITALHRLDSLSTHKKFKAGVLYCRANQTTEEEMYSNRDAGPAFEEFLEILGQRVRMKGFTKHRAGLDPKNDSTGEYSVYATHQGCEVMFHVSTLLPFTPTNSKQLLRKRHIGNDIVTIVFQEPGAAPFSPRAFRSHFQHVFIVVRAVNPCSHNTKYHVAVTRFHSVPAFGPPLPHGATFTKGKTFANFLLAKVINGEIATLRSEKFSSLSIRTRHEYLKDLVTNHSTTVPLDQPNKFSLIGFSRGLSSRRDKSRSLGFCPSSAILGALSWSVITLDCTLNTKVESCLGISSECVVLVEANTGFVLLTIPTCSVLGWTAMEAHSVKIFYHQGELLTVLVRPDAPLDHKESTVSGIVSRLEAVTQGAHTQDILLERTDDMPHDALLGFNVHDDGVVTEVTPCGPAFKQGLTAGSRIMEICHVAMPTLAQDTMVELLKTSRYVSLLVIPPHSTDNSPRRGCNVPTCAFYLTDTSEGDYENLSSPESSGSSASDARGGTAVAPSVKDRPSATSKGRSASRANRRRHGSRATRGAPASSAAIQNRCERSFSPPRSSNSSGYGTGNSARSFSMEPQGAAQPPAGAVYYSRNQLPASQSATPPQAEHSSPTEADEDFASLADSTITLTGSDNQQLTPVHPDFNTATISSTTTIASNHSLASNHSYNSNHSNQSSKTSHSNHSTRSHHSNKSSGTALSLPSDSNVSSQQPIYDSRPVQSRHADANSAVIVQGTSQPEQSSRLLNDVNNSSQAEPLYDTHDKYAEPIYDRNKPTESLYDTSNLYNSTAIYDTMTNASAAGSSSNKNNKGYHGDYNINASNEALNSTNEPIYDSNSQSHKSVYDNTSSLYESLPLNHPIARAANTPGVPYQSTGNSPYKRPFQPNTPGSSSSAASSSSTATHTPSRQSPVTPSKALPSSNSSSSCASSSSFLSPSKSANKHPLPSHSSAGSSADHSGNPPPHIKKSIKPPHSFLSNYRDATSGSNPSPPPPLPARFAQINRKAEGVYSAVSPTPSPPLHTSSQVKQSSDVTSNKSSSSSSTFQSMLGIWQQYGGTTNSGGRRVPSQQQSNHPNSAANSLPVQSNYAVPPPPVAVTGALRAMHSNTQRQLQPGNNSESHCHGASAAPAVPGFPRSANTEDEPPYSESPHHPNLRHHLQPSMMSSLPHSSSSRSDTPSSSTSSRTESPSNYRMGAPLSESAKPRLRSQKKQHQQHHRNSANYSSAGSSTFHQELFKLISPDYDEETERNKEVNAARLDADEVALVNHKTGYQSPHGSYRSTPEPGVLGAQQPPSGPPSYSDVVKPPPTTNKFGLSPFPNPNDTRVMSLPPSTENSSCANTAISSASTPVRPQVQTPSHHLSSNHESIYESISLPFPPDGSAAKVSSLVSKYSTVDPHQHASLKEDSTDFYHRGNYYKAAVDQNANPSLSSSTVAVNDASHIETPADIIDRLRGGVREAMEAGKFGSKVIPTYSPSDMRARDPNNDVDQEWSSLVNAATHAIGKTTRAMSDLKKFPVGSSPYHPIEPVFARPTDPAKSSSNTTSSCKNQGGTDAPSDRNSVNNRPNPTELASVRSNINNNNSINCNRIENNNSSTSGKDNIVHQEDLEKLSMRERITELEAALQTERCHRDELSAQLASLKNENARLQEDSRAAARQLHHFTDWFFATIDKT